MQVVGSLAMDRRAPRSRRSDCPISVALELIGDEWSLLIVRDLMFKGLKSFQEFSDAGERIATNVLTDRLARLETAGILARRRDPEDGRRFIYTLTEKGIDLAPVLVEIVLWSAQYEETAAPAEVVEAMRKRRPQFLREVRERWLATAVPG